MNLVVNTPISNKRARSVSFDEEIAAKAGLEEAALLYHIEFWITKNAKTKHSFHRGHYWTYNPVKSYQRQFPFWTEAQIRRIFNNLKKKGLIKTGNFNKTRYDRTLWYTSTRKEFLKSICAIAEMDLRESGNQNEQSSEPIPDKYTDKETYPLSAREATERARKTPLLPSEAPEDDKKSTAGAGTSDNARNQPLVRQLPRGGNIANLILWAEERRGTSFVDHKSQVQALNKMSQAKIRASDAQDRWMEMEDDDFWREKGFDFWNVLKSFDKKPPS